MATAALSSCTTRQNKNQCVTGDQKACPCLGGGDGVQVCQADGTYAACQCVQADLSASAGDDMAVAPSPSDDIAVQPGGLEMARVDDLSLMTDASASPDGGNGCVGGTPNEDSDGLGNACDLCPDDSDPTPVDTDGDRLPDACDPDPSTNTNALLYFDPLDIATGHWSTASALISGGFMTLDTMGQNVLTSNNATDALPSRVRVQAHIFLKGIYGGTAFSDAGVFVGDNPDPTASNANGVLCTLHYHPNMSTDSLDIYPVTNGTLGAVTTAATSFNPAMYRMRLTNRNGAWTCETTSNGLNPATVTLTKSVTAPLYISLRSENMEAHVHAVVAESIATHFFPDIQAGLDARGCTLGACHGAAGTGAVMVVKPMATTQADIDANYMSAMNDVNMTTPAQSPFLTKPLIGSGVTHSGTKPFPSTTDSVYLTWLNWIAAGAPK